MVSERQILTKLRKICLALPASAETVTFGHPTFRVDSKTFAVFEEWKGELGICMWVSLRVYAARLNWSEVAELVKGSYRLVAPKARRPVASTAEKRPGR
jgi:predicted DNA-binding protein (MmcQ/YjbR family)